MKEPGLTAAIEAAGGISALARQLGITHGAVSQWRQVPLERVAAVEAATGVARERLRPDLFGAPPQGMAARAAARAARLAAEARAQGIDPAVAAEERKRRWQEENWEAIEAWNRWTEENELPLARYRMF